MFELLLRAPHNKTKRNIFISFNYICIMIIYEKYIKVNTILDKLNKILLKCQT